MNIDLLRNAGIDYPKGLQRFLGDESLYDDVLALFLEDTNMAEAEAAFARGDDKALFASIHALKGACGNTEMTDIYAVACTLTELLRHGDGARSEIDAQFHQLKACYDRAIDGIRRAMA